MSFLKKLSLGRVLDRSPRNLLGFYDCDRARQFSCHLFDFFYSSPAKDYFGRYISARSMGSIPSLSLDEEWQGSAHFFQSSSSRCADFKSFSNKDIANLSGFIAAEVGFLVVKPFKKHPTNGGQTGHTPDSCLQDVLSGLPQIPLLKNRN